MSTTPRTDAFDRCESFGDSPDRWRDFARTLESELSTLRAAIDLAHATLDDSGLVGTRAVNHRSLSERISGVLKQLAALSAENDRLRRAYVRPDDIRAQLGDALARIERLERSAK